MLCLVGSWRMNSFMTENWLEDADYSVVVRHRDRSPNLWRWEIYRAGTTFPIKQAPLFFHSMALANKAGTAALKQLLAKLNA